MEHNTEKAVNMKLILCIFEQLSGLKINFHKSELFYFGQQKKLNMTIDKFLAVNLVPFLLDTWAFRYTIENFEMLNGIL